MSKKTVLITGCSEGGIGAGLALEFSKRGFHVYAAVRTPAKAASLASPTIEVVQMDTSSADSIKACAAKVLAKTGGTLDVLVNNAAQMYMMPLMDVDVEEAKKMWEVNVWGYLRIVQAFAPAVVKTRGTIVMMSSVAGSVWSPWQGIYNSSKSATTMLSENLRNEMAPLGVKVVIGMLGAIRSKVWENYEPLQLPEDSFYLGAKETFDNSHSWGMEPEDQDKTVKNLVNDILKGTSGRVYRGKVARLGSFAGAYLPTWMVDYALGQGKGYDKVKRPA